MVLLNLNNRPIKYLKLNQVQSIAVNIARYIGIRVFETGIRLNLVFDVKPYEKQIFDVYYNYILSKKSEYKRHLMERLTLTVAKYADKFTSDLCPTADNINI